MRTKGRLAVAALAVVALAAGVPLLQLDEAAAGEARLAGAQPIVLDVDLTPAGDCGGPVRGTLAVYHPGGVAASGEVEWRVRAGGATRTGTVAMEKSVATAAFTLDGPADSILVDSRVPGGSYGKAWRDRLTAGCDPLTVVSVGDSVVWDQGLDHDQKFPRLLAEKLGAATGRGFRNRDYSISGAVLDAPGLPAGNQDSACRGETYAQDPDGDGEMELGEVTAQMPDVFCQLERAAAQAERVGEKVDLVVMNGCINDLDSFLGVGVGFTPGSEDVPRGVERECSGIGAAAENPAKDVPYFSGAKVGYGGRGMRAAIEKAHALPGRPKVVLVDFYYAMSRASLPALRRQCDSAGLNANQLPRCYDAIGFAADRYEQYTRYSSEAYRVAAQAANAASADGPYAVAADGLFTAEQAVLAADAKLWGNPTVDPAFPLRKQACPEFSPTVGQCLSAAIAHPNVEGAKQYADNLALNPAVRRWFRLGAALAPVTVLSRLGSAVTLSVPPTAGAQYRWFFGDGATAVTDEPTVTHTYDGAGPALPRVLVAGVLHEAAAPLAG